MFFNPDDFVDGIQPLSRKEIAQLGLQPMLVQEFLHAIDPLPAFRRWTDDDMNEI